MKRLLGIIGIAFAVSVHAQPSFITNGLIAYYPFNGDATDASGNGRNGTVTGAVLTSDRFGAPNSAFYFNGSNSVISVAGPWFSNQSARSVSIWFKAEVSHYGDLFDFGALQTTHQRFGMIRDVPPNAGQLYFVGQGDDSLVPGQYALNDWNQVVVTFSAGTGAVYLNGAQVGAFTKPLLTTDGTAPFVIGGFSDGRTPTFYEGELDDIRVYNRVLSTNEVAQLYALESTPTINIRKAVYLDSGSLHIGANYQVQVSTNLTTWTNVGAPFTATNSYWRTTNYWDVNNWDQLYFRLQVSP